MMTVCSSATVRSTSRRFTCRSRDRELVEEAHEIWTGPMRAHTSSPRTLPGTTDLADIVNVPGTRGTGPPVREGGSDIHHTGSFRDSDHDPHVPVLIGDAGITVGTPVKLIKTEG